jgi:hypothetical protein
MKINKISFKQGKNEVQLDNKSVNVESLRPTPTSLIPAFSLYDSNWIDVLPVDIEGATSQVENYELPQKVPFEFSFNLEVPEVYLPFINIAILAKPSTDQKVIGTGQFIFSSLREVILHLYTWLGVGFSITAGPGFSWWEYRADPHVIPYPLPAPTMTIPPPTGCYTRISYWGEISCPSVGSGLGPYTLNSAGTHLWAGGNWVLLKDWMDGIFEVWFPGGGGQLYIVVSTGQQVYFNHPQLHFPIPVDGQSTFPCGGLVSPDPTNWPNQLWSSEGLFTFQEYMALGHTYAQAVATFAKYYPEIFITPESHGIPYKCYARINTDTVVSGEEKIKIVKTDDRNFQYSVYGNLLLVSPANIETDWSDPDFPTFKPNSTVLSTRLKVFFKNHPVNFNQTKEYKK